MEKSLMDVKRNTSLKKKNKWTIAILIGLTLSTASYWVYSMPPAASKVATKELWIGQVKKGSLPLQANGFGILESKVQRYLTAPFTAVIEEIILKPGASVTPDSIILRISNPDIGQAVIQAKVALNAQYGKSKQLILTQARESLIAENELDELALDLEVFHARLAAEEKMAKQGIVTQLKLLETQAEVNKLSGRLKNAKKRLVQLVALHLQGKNIQKEQIDEQKSLLTLAENRLKQLDVRAGISGVLQALPIELGQSLTTGSQLALVGGTKDLIAVIQVPQRDVHGMRKGMSANVDTRGGIAKGKVIRIDPVVKDGNIEVEISLTGTLPNNARPSLNVAAKINLGELKDVLYIEVPVNTAEHSRHQLFKLDQQGNTAQLSWLSFGAQSGRTIVIKSGAQQNDRFILSEMKQYAQLDEITLTQE